MITLIAAMSRNRIIGKNNTLPRSIPEDLKRFKILTSGNVILMGRKTYESIGSLLPKRVNLILSSTLKLKDIPLKDQELTEFKIFSNMTDRNNRYKNNTSKHIYIIGGGEIYQQFLPLADDIQLTLIEQDIKGDTLFPDFEDQFREDSRTSIMDEKDKLNEVPLYHFIHYTRIK